jgi:hypothetical protein
VKQSIQTLQDEDGIFLESTWSEGSIATQHRNPLAKGVRGGQYHLDLAMKHYECIPVFSPGEIDKVFGIDLDEAIISKVLGQDVQAMTDSVNKDFRFQWYRF